MANDKPTTPEKEAPVAPQQQSQEDALTSRMSRLDKAHSLIKNYTMGAIAVGLVPAPMIDLVALSAIQLKLVHSAAAIYEVPFQKNMAKSIIGSILGSSIAVTLAMPVSSFIKFIPILGQSSGSISTALVGSASTYAIGKIFVEHFESGGTFLDFDEEKAKVHFKSLYDEGRAFVASQKSAAA